MATLDVEATIEKYRPKKPEEPASGGTLWHLNRHGLLLEAIAQAHRLLLEAIAAGEAEAHDPNRPVITKLVAWEVMADAQRRGVTF